MTDYINRRTDITSSTKQIYSRSLHFTEGFFGKKKLLIDVTVGDAKDFVRWLRQPGRIDALKGLNENTARKMTDKLKTVFKAALEDELLEKNPFKGIATSIKSDEKKQVNVSADTIRLAIEKAPDKEFAAIIAFARFGGLRTPSEFRHLKHCLLYTSPSPRDRG